MKCSKCGIELENGDEFCSGCGEQMKEEGIETKENLTVYVISNIVITSLTGLILIFLIWTKMAGETALLRINIDEKELIRLQQILVIVLIVNLFIWAKGMIHFLRRKSERAPTILQMCKKFIENLAKICIRADYSSELKPKVDNQTKLGKENKVLKEEIARLKVAIESQYNMAKEIKDVRIVNGFSLGIEIAIGMLIVYVVLIVIAFILFGSMLSSLF